ncbi:MAG: DUF4864 domain-containing protein [Chthoniobacteraceae bacterium]
MSPAWQRIKLGIVGATFSVCVAAAVVRSPAARRVPAPLPQEIYSVVMDKLAAVRAADYPAAYRHVSLAVQERFNLDEFSGQVRTDHPDLARFERVEFGAVVVQGRRAAVPAYFFLHDGGIALVHYALVREERAWKIESSRVSRRWSRGHRVGGERT